jgi:hypothetical protein
MAIVKNYLPWHTNSAHFHMCAQNRVAMVDLILFNVTGKIIFPRQFFTLKSLKFAKALLISGSFSLNYQEQLRKCTCTLYTVHTGLVYRPSVNKIFQCCESRSRSACIDPHIWFVFPGSGSVFEMRIRVRIQKQRRWSKFTNKPDLQVPTFSKRILYLRRYVLWPVTYIKYMFHVKF